MKSVVENYFHRLRLALPAWATKQPDPPSVSESIASGLLYMADQLNPIEEADIYVSVSIKTNYQKDIPGVGKVKASTVYGGFQVGANTNDGLYADLMTFDKSYVSYETTIAGVKNEFRVQPLNGLLGDMSTSASNMRGEYSPQLRVLTTIPGLQRKFFGGALEGSVQTELGWKYGQGATVGVRAKVETPSSFNIGGHQIIVPVSVEATAGFRLKLKLPKFFN